MTLDKQHRERLARLIELLETPGYEMGEWFELPHDQGVLRSVRYHEPVHGDLCSLAFQFGNSPVERRWDDQAISGLESAPPDECAQFVHWACWGERHCAGLMLYHQDAILTALRRIRDAVDQP